MGRRSGWAHVTLEQPTPDAIISSYFKNLPCPADLLAISTTFCMKSFLPKSFWGLISLVRLKKPLKGSSSL